MIDLLDSRHLLQSLSWHELEADGGEAVQAAADGGQGAAEYAGHEEAGEAGNVSSNMEDVQGEHLVTFPHL